MFSRRRPVSEDCATQLGPSSGRHLTSAADSAPGTQDTHCPLAMATCGRYSVLLLSVLGVKSPGPTRTSPTCSSKAAGRVQTRWGHKKKQALTGRNESRRVDSPWRERAQDACGSDMSSTKNPQSDLRKVPGPFDRSTPRTVDGGWPRLGLRDCSEGPVTRPLTPLNHGVIFAEW